MAEGEDDEEPSGWEEGAPDAWASDAFEVSTRDLKGPVSVVDLEGRSQTDEQARERVAKVMADLLARGRRHIVINGERLAWVAADVVGELVADTERLWQCGGNLAFACLPRDVEDYLVHLGVGDFLRICDSEAEAIGAATMDKRPRNDRKPGAVLSPHRLEIVRDDPKDGVGLLGLKGSLDRVTTKGFMEAMSQLMADGRPRVVLDCTRLLNLTVEGAEALVQWDTDVKKRGGAMHLAKVWGPVGGLFDTYRFRQVFKVFDDSEQALAAFEPKST